MAKNQRDFRPDKTDPELLDQLYLTKKQRLGALKWLLYSLLVLMASVVQDVVMCRFSLYGATTDLVPCVIMMIGIYEGAESGCLFCCLSSLVYLFSGTAPGYHAMPLITLLAVGAAIFRQGYLKRRFFTTFLCTAAVVMLYELAVFGVGLFFAQTHVGRVSVFLLTGAVTLPAAVIIYPLVASIGKIGGESWKE